MKTMTRRQVIEAWNIDDRYHDYYVCPDCRDILTKYADGNLRCSNDKCLNNTVFDSVTGGGSECK